MRILLIDNYDSFTFNLVHAIEPMVDELVVWRNDRFNISDVASFDKIIFSPGPALPDEAGLMMDVIREYHDKIPMLGVCLGFQALIEFFGGELINLEPVRHGESKQIKITHHQSLFNGLDSKEEVGLYHSWGIRTNELPVCFQKLAEDETDVVMAIQHREWPLYGVQFHPESVMTPQGNKMLENWIKMT
ncbi:aminodeoxychorismate/anthranilate synthase component II [bacterium SCSIO 12643]|nr:aminodeoxychorismate/anthranilate synthase component II [bacterium SCSIO 12643]